jgi:hypothetical protein
MKNRMHELCSFGSVRDEGRKALVYSEILQAAQMPRRNAGCAKYLGLGND